VNPSTVNATRTRELVDDVDCLDCYLFLCSDSFYCCILMRWLADNCYVVMHCITIIYSYGVIRLIAITIIYLVMCNIVL